MMEKFHYKAGSTAIDLPKFSQIPFGVMRKIRKEGDAEATFLFLEEVADAKNLAKIDKLTMDEVGQLIEAWQKDSGITTGESEASSTP